MKRIEALKLLAMRSADYPVVVTCAATSRELASLGDRDNYLYLLDSMGLTSSVGLGLAMALDPTTVDRVVVLDGDGSLLMNLGSLATIGFLQPKKLVLVVLDNATYASTGGIPTYSSAIDLGQVAAACGISVAQASDLADLETAFADALRTPGPHVVHVRIEPGNAANTPLLLLDPVVISNRFAGWLAALAR